MNTTSKKKYIITPIILLVIGFASLTTTLITKGRVGIKIKENDFDVYFSNVYLDDVEHKEFISSNGKTITFQTNKLINIGEQTILKYEIKNASTQYDATININFDSSSLENEYVSVEMKKDFEDDIIKAGKKETGRLIITLKKPALEDNSLNFTINMDANATSVDYSGNAPINYEKPGDYSFSGQMVDKDNNPLKNKTIVIISGNGIHYTQTDLDGNIYADNLADGTQEIYIMDNSIEEVKNMSYEEIKNKSKEKITITSSTTGNAAGDNTQIKSIYFEKTEAIDTISLKIGNNILERIIKDESPIEFNIDTNETEIELSGLGLQTITPGENIFELELTNGKKVEIIVNNVRPTPPILTGGSNIYVNDRKATISVEKSGSALSEIEYYEYYISDNQVIDFTNVTPTGTTDNKVEITTEGTKYVYYRTVSKNKTYSSWSDFRVVKLDYSNPTLEIISVTTSSNKIAIKYNAKDEYSGLKSVTCELGENNVFTKEGIMEENLCTFNNLTTNKLYNYRMCVEDNASNEQVCKIGEARTNEIHNPIITFDSIPSSSGEYYLGQTAKINFDATGVENPTYYIKSTRKGTSNINVTKACGNGDSPSVCTDITPTTTIDKDVWYQVNSNININYNESSDEYSKIIALVYDGYNYSNKTTGTIGKIAYAAADLEYTNPLAPNVTNVQEAIDDLYTRLR